MERIDRFDHRGERTGITYCIMQKTVNGAYVLWEKWRTLEIKYIDRGVKIAEQEQQIAKHKASIAEQEQQIAKHKASIEELEELLNEYEAGRHE